MKPKINKILRSQNSVNRVHSREYLIINTVQLDLVDFDPNTCVQFPILTIYY